MIVSAFPTPPFLFKQVRATLADRTLTRLYEPPLNGKMHP